MVFTQQSQNMRQLDTIANAFVPFEIEYTYDKTLENIEYYLAYDYVSQDMAQQIQSIMDNDFTIEFGGIDQLTWNVPNMQYYQVKILMVEATNNEKISNECDILKSSGDFIYPINNSFNLSIMKQLTSGKYRVNILFESNWDLRFSIAYHEITIDYKVPENNITGVIAGTTVGVLAVFGLGIGYFFWRRKKKLSTSDNQFGILSFIQE